MHSRPSLTRRHVLGGFLGLTGAAGISLVTGCSLLGSSREATPPPPDPLVGFLRDTIALAELYDAGLAAVPALAPVITAPRDAHRAHAQALADAIGAAAPQASGTGTASPGKDRSTVLAAIIAAESKGRDDAVAACLATTGRLAPLVGSIAAARATHLEVLA